MKYLSYFNENKTDLVKIGNDIYLSKEIEKLPINSLIVKHTYDDDVKSGELGLFCCELEQKSYRDCIFISIGKKAKIFTIESTEEFLKEKDLFFSDNEYIIKKYSDEEEIRSFYDLFSLDSDVVFYEMQKEVVNLLSNINFDILEMTYEDDSIPHQYLIKMNPHLRKYKPMFAKNRNE